MKISIVQENPVVGDVKGNLRLALKTIKRLKKEVIFYTLTEVFSQIKEKPLELKGKKTQKSLLLEIQQIRMRL